MSSTEYSYYQRACVFHMLEISIRIFSARSYNTSSTHTASHVIFKRNLLKSVIRVLQERWNLIKTKYTLECLWGLPLTFSTPKSPHINYIKNLFFFLFIFICVLNYLLLAKIIFIYYLLFFLLFLFLIFFLIVQLKKKIIKTIFLLCALWLLQKIKVSCQSWN